MVVIVILKAFDASLSMKCNPGLITRILKSSINSLKASIISLSIILFIDVVRMSFQPYTYMPFMYYFPLLDVMAKRLHRFK